MKITIDFENKQIELLEDTSLKDVNNLIEKLPELENFTIIPKTEFVEIKVKEYPSPLKNPYEPFKPRYPEQPPLDNLPTTPINPTYPNPWDTIQPWDNGIRYIHVDRLPNYYDSPFKPQCSSSSSVVFSAN